MKKIALFLLVIISGISQVMADELFKISRSSIIDSARTNIVLTTAPVRIWKIEVSSGNPASAFTIYGGTAPGFITSSDYFDTSDSQIKHYLGQTYNGAIFSSSGSSVIRVYWDYLFTPPRLTGHSEKGLEIR